jgi:UDPglucose 6-dehydrogenase
VNRPVVGFAGLTHLGVNSAAAAAAKGFQVVGFHPDPARVQALAASRSPYAEPGLEALLAEHGARLSFHAEPEALSACDLVYLAVDVPTDDEGQSDLAPISAMIAAVRPVMKPGAALVILCQVPPGFTRALALPPERLFYQVETLVFGQAVQRALEPERFIVGAARPDQPLHPALERFLAAFGCPILPMAYESAELAKISINMVLAATITTANVMAELCERVGADWLQIAPALKLDRRIGPYSYLAPGLGLSGGNIERDLATVARLAALHGADQAVVTAWTANSARRKAWPLGVLRAELLDGAPGARVAVLGLAYKEDTNSTKNAPSLALIEGLREPFTVYDPQAPGAAAGPLARPAPSALAAAEGADAVCIMTPWAEFRALDPAALAQAMRGTLVIDPYRMLDPARTAQAGLRVFRLGASAC